LKWPDEIVLNLDMPNYAYQVGDIFDLNGVLGNCAGYLHRGSGCLLTLNEYDFNHAFHVHHPGPMGKAGSFTAPEGTIVTAVGVGGGGGKSSTPSGASGNAGSSSSGGSAGSWVGTGSGGGSKRDDTQGQGGYSNDIEVTWHEAAAKQPQKGFESYSINGEIREVPVAQRACVCGQDSVGGGFHTPYCGKYEKL